MPILRRLLPAALAVPLLISSCSHLPGLSDSEEPSVVYALGTRDGFQSPLQAALKPACPALLFSGEGFALNGAHRKTLAPLAKAWEEKGKPRYLITGYVPPGLPEDFARSLTERRAQAVRQHLIESGIEAANIQTVGFGFDSPPSSPTSNVVVIYQQ